jgi:ribosomal protein S18 acetylase RimI-like enzyme
MQATPILREVRVDDLEALLRLEALCFECDRLSRRSFQRWIQRNNCILQILEVDRQVRGYGLVLLHAGTRLARLYSIALHPETRGRGFASHLMLALEAAAAEQGRIFMRLEVAKQNRAAIQLYQRLGYHVFGELPNYYEDHSDALRMQKRIRYLDPAQEEITLPWYGQTTHSTSTIPTRTR